MCINPTITYKKSRDGSLKRIEFPCGKCSECVSKKHSAFALEAVLEARAASSVHMVTLTYNNDSVPFRAVRRVTREGITYEDDAYFVDRSTYFHDCVKRCLGVNMDGSKALSCKSVVMSSARVDDANYSELIVTPSLRREDVRLFLKKCRIQFQRYYGEKLEGRYAFFGEYGDLTHRPHYHGLLYNFSDRAISFLKSRWEKEFGFCQFVPLAQFNADGSPARVKAANYVSKYIAKDMAYKAVSDGLVEAPRRFCSKGFGTSCLNPSEINSLKNFTDAKI